MRPVHPGDNLFVAYQAEMLTAVLHLLRASGFEKAPLRSKPANLPKGIWQRKDGGCIVKHKKANGSSGYKYRPTLDAAVAFLADTTAEHDDADGEHPGAVPEQEVGNDSDGAGSVQQGDSEADPYAAAGGRGSGGEEAAAGYAA